jgi:protein phosphatase 1G
VFEKNRITQFFEF